MRLNDRLSAGLLLSGIAAMGAAVFAPASNYHPVTRAMLTSATEKAGARIPARSLEASDGRTASIAKLAKDRPAVLVFIKDRCPCSELAEPFFHRLYAAYGTRAEFVGIIDGDRSVARDWAQRHQTPYIVLADPDLRFIRACGAERSAYVAFIAQGGSIERLWPGFSAGMLTELGGRLADRTGSPNSSIDVEGAPMTLSSGCDY